MSVINKQRNDQWVQCHSVSLRTVIERNGGTSTGCNRVIEQWFKYGGLYPQTSNKLLAIRFTSIAVKIIICVKKSENHRQDGR